jgi:hypothetical protein
MRIQVILFTLLAAACASQQDSGSPVTVQLTQVGGPANVFYYPGPVNVQYEVAVTNPTNQQIALRRLDLRTEGPGAYALRTSGSPMNVKIAPKSSATFTVSAWGQARGGYIASTEPVSLYATAYFDGPSGTFVKLIHENAWQP